MFTLFCRRPRLAWLFPEPLQRHEVATTWPERKYSEKLENIRVVWRIFVQWFIFFWTINIAILQLEIPRLSAMGSIDLIDRFIAVMFLCLNVFGIGVCYVVQRACSDANAIAREISTAVDGAKDFPFDRRVLNYSTVACGLSLVLNCVLWVLLIAASFLGRQASEELVRRLLSG